MRLLLATQLLAIAFVLATGHSLPPVMASHFVAGGTVDGFMPRDAYLGFTIALLVGLPIFIALLSGLTSILPTRFINLPNREYWLAPERKADTLAYFRKQGFRFGIILVIFLCFTHWLVVQANTQTPPRLPELALFAGMAVFLVGVVSLVGGFIVHFRRRR